MSISPGGPSPTTPPAGTPTPDPTSTWAGRGFSFDRVLALLGAVWVVAVLASGSLRANPVALGVTAAFIAAAFLTGVVTLMVRKRILILLNLAQVGLFVALPWQVYDVLGHEHYRTDHDPAWYDWLVFTLAHVVRAVDFLDILVSYGISLKNVHHGSDLSGCLLVWLHVAVDLFLFAAVVHGLSILFRPADAPGTELTHRKKVTLGKIVRGVLAVPLSEAFRKARWRYLLFCVVAWFVLAYRQGWSPLDWLLWPLDNVLRAIDFVGVMDIFDWRLHGVTPDETIPTLGYLSWTHTIATFGVFFRFLVLLFLAEWLAYLSLRVFGRLGLQTIEQLAEHLRSPNAKVRERATGLLVSFGREAIPSLVGVLAAPEKEAREAASDALHEIDPEWKQSPEAKSAVQPLAASLGTLLDKNAFEGAVKALGELGPVAVEAVPALIHSFAGELGRFGRRYRLEESLDKIEPNWRTSSHVGELIPEVVQTLQTTTAVDEQRGAIELLVTLKATAAVPALLAFAASDSDPFPRVKAIEALSQLGATVGEVLPTLNALVKSSPPTVQVAAAAALTKISPPADMVPRLIALLEDPEADMDAIRALASLGAAAAPAIPALTALATKGHPRVRYEAAALLARLGPPADAVPYLVALIDEPRACESAMDTLGWLGAAAVPAIPRIITALVKAQTLSERETAIKALGKLGPLADMAIPALRQMLRIPGIGCYDKAIQALSKIDPDWLQRPDASEIATGLGGILQSDTDQWREEVVRALNLMGEVARSAVPALLGEFGRLRGCDPWYVVTTLEAVSPTWAESPAAREAVRGLAKRISAARKPDDATAMVDLLNKHVPGWAESPEGQSAVANLVERLGQCDDFDQSSLIGSLGDIGPAALPLAGRAVRRFLSHEKLRERAERALKRMEPTAGGGAGKADGS